MFGELLKDLGINEEQFVSACEMADKHEENKKYINQILSVDDFIFFKKMMQGRNKELNEQAIKYSNAETTRIDYFKRKDNWSRQKFHPRTLPKWKLKK